MSKNYSTKVEIKGDPTGAIAAVGSVTKSLKRLETVTKGITVKLNVGGISNAMNRLKSSMGGFATQIAVGAGAAALAFKPLLDTGIEFEKMTTLMENFFDGAEGGKKSFAWAQDLAYQTPVSLEQVIKSMIKLKSSGMDPMDGSLKAIIDSVAKMGGSTEQFDRVTLAISQMYSKTKISAQEMNQLAENNIPAWKILSEVTGKTVGELQKMGEKKLLTQEYVQQFIDGLKAFGSGGSEKMMKTFAGGISNLEDVFWKFKVGVMQSGVFEYLKQNLFALLTYLTPERMKAIATTMGTELTGVFKELGSALKDIWPVLKAVGSAIATLALSLGGYGNALKLIIAAMAIGPVINFAAMLFQIGKSAVGIFEIGSAFLASRTAIVAAGGALSSLVGPVGFFTITAVGLLLTGLVPAIVYVKTHLKEFKPLIDMLKAGFQTLGWVVSGVFNVISVTLQFVGNLMSQVIINKLRELNSVAKMLGFGQASQSLNINQTSKNLQVTKALPDTKSRVNGNNTQKDQLHISLGINHLTGRTKVEQVAYTGGKDMSFKASLGQMLPA
jgi:tape measure domain-containing protein